MLKLYKIILVVAMLLLLSSCEENAQPTTSNETTEVKDSFEPKLVEYAINTEAPTYGNLDNNKIVELIGKSNDFYDYKEITEARIYEWDNNKYVVVGPEQAGWAYAGLFKYNVDELVLLVSASKINIIWDYGFDAPLVEIYDWSHMGNGSMSLYKLNSDSLQLVREDVVIVDKHYEYGNHEIAIDSPESISFVFMNDHPKADYVDIDSDGDIDIFVSGIYEGYKFIEEENELFYTEEIYYEFINDNNELALKDEKLKGTIFYDISGFH